MTAWCGLTLVEMQMLRFGRGMQLGVFCGIGIVAASGVLLAGRWSGHWKLDLLVAGATTGMTVATVLSTGLLRQEKIRLELVAAMSIAAAVASLALLSPESG
jgi:hypothetical protein